MGVGVSVEEVGVGGVVDGDGVPVAVGVSVLGSPGRACFRTKGSQLVQNVYFHTPSLVAAHRRRGN